MKASQRMDIYFLDKTWNGFRLFFISNTELLDARGAAASIKYLTGKPSKLSFSLVIISRAPVGYS